MASASEVYSPPPVAPPLDAHADSRAWLEALRAEALRARRPCAACTRWAYKFVLLETATRLRRRAWQGREVVLEPERWPELADPGASPHELV
jgi:hypothetical protein